MFLRATKIFEKMDEENETFKELVINYERHKEHAWFRKTLNILEKGLPIKIYTSRH